MRLRFADVERLGTPMGPHDMLIGAHAREFRRLPGVRVEDWVDEGGSPA